MNDVYSAPRYYEIAFSFRDIPHEVDVLEECMRRFSRADVRRVLELGCGPGVHMEELCRRGYEYVGLDLSQDMLDHARAKAEEKDLRAQFIRADMADFRLSRKVQFAATMIGSLYVPTTEKVLSHCRSVAAALEKGGLYFLDWCVYFSWGSLGDDEDTRWSITRDGVKIHATVHTRVLDRLEQQAEETITLRVRDGEARHVLKTRTVRRIIFPQELLLLVERMKEFEFVEWWNDWDLDDPIRPGMGDGITRPIIVLRRK